jgi:hypothetical protein
VRAALFIAITLLLCGCVVSDREIAKRCDVDESQLQAAFAEVLASAPHSSRKVGRCTLTRSEGQQRVLVAITGQAWRYER